MMMDNKLLKVTNPRWIRRPVSLDPTYPPRTDSASIDTSLSQEDKPNFAAVAAQPHRSEPHHHGLDLLASDRPTVETNGEL